MSTEAVVKKKRIDEYIVRAHAKLNTAQMLHDRSRNLEQNLLAIRNEAIDFVAEVEGVAKDIMHKLKSKADLIQPRYKEVIQKRPLTKADCTMLLASMPAVDSLQKESKAKVKTLRVRLMEMSKKVGTNFPDRYFNPQYEKADKLIKALETFIANFDATMKPIRETLEKAKTLPA